MRRNQIILLFFSFFFLKDVFAYEYAGFKAEFMNAEKTNFYGGGLFTSNKRFDAEIEFFISSKGFEAGAKNISPDVRMYFYSFAGYFHFIRTDSISYYIGTGIMPLLPKAYIYHATLGMDFFWSENFRIFYNFRYLYNNASGPNINYYYPRGATFSFGFKYTWDFLKI